MLIRGRQFQQWAQAIFCLKINPMIFHPFLFPPKELVAGFNLDSLICVPLGVMLLKCLAILFTRKGSIVVLLPHGSANLPVDN
jgi:hypothetical protein